MKWFLTLMIWYHMPGTKKKLLAMMISLIASLGGTYLLLADKYPAWYEEKLLDQEAYKDPARYSVHAVGPYGEEEEFFFEVYCKHRDGELNPCIIPGVGIPALFRDSLDAVAAIPKAIKTESFIPPEETQMAREQAKSNSILREIIYGVKK